MPFDEGCSDDEEGGAGGPHDEEGMVVAAHAGLASLMMTAKANGVCHRCSMVSLMQMLIEELGLAVDDDTLTADYAETVTALVRRALTKVDAAVKTKREETKP
jgi:hypothetical protein